MATVLHNVMTTILHILTTPSIIIPIIISLVLLVLIILSTWKVFIKNGKPGWAAIIPIYREIVIWQLSELPLKYLLLGLLLPVIGPFYMMSTYMYFAQKQNRSRWFGFGLYALPFIFMPILAYTDAKDKKKQESALLCGIFLLVLSIFIIVAIVPWNSLFPKFTLFDKFNEWLATIDVFKNFIAEPAVTETATATPSGILPALGNWQMLDVSVFLLLISGLVIVFSKEKVNDFIPEISDKVKKALPIALVSVLVSLVLIVIVTSGVGVTIVNFITKPKLATISSSFGGLIGSITTADFYYYLSTLYVPFKAVAGSDYSVAIAISVQAIFYLAMIIAPTSVGLLIGLRALDIPYGSWLKYILKVFLPILVLVIAVPYVMYLVIAKKILLAVLVSIISIALFIGIIVAIYAVNKLLSKK